MKITNIYSTSPYVEIIYTNSTEWAPDWNQPLEPPVSVEIRLTDQASDAITWAVDQMHNIESLKTQMGINPLLDQAIKNYQESVDTLTVIGALVGKHDVQ